MSLTSDCIVDPFMVKTAQQPYYIDTEPTVALVIFSETNICSLHKTTITK